MPSQTPHIKEPAQVNSDSLQSDLYRNSLDVWLDTSLQSGRNKRSPRWIIGVMMLRALLVLFSLISTGCATIASPNAAANDSRAEIKSTSNGTIVGSFTQIGRTYVRSISLRNVESGKKTTISQGTIFNRNDFDGIIDGIGIVYAYDLPPGQYEFFNYEIAFNDGFVSKTWRPKRKFSIPFSVDEGVVKYLGDIRLIPLQGRNIVGLPVAAGGVFMFANESDRDIPLIRSRFRELADKQVSVAVPASGAIDDASIIFQASSSDADSIDTQQAPAAGTAH